MIVTSLHQKSYLLFSSVTIVNTFKQNQAIENSIDWPVISPLPGHVMGLMTAMQQGNNMKLYQAIQILLPGQLSIVWSHDWSHDTCLLHDYRGY